jgi:hypothetical protein
MELDIAALIATAEPGSTIVLPTGRFHITKPLLVSQNNITRTGHAWQTQGKVLYYSLYEECLLETKKFIFEYSKLTI